MGKSSGGSSLKWVGTRGDDTAYVASLDALKHTTYDGGAGYDTLNLSHLGSGISLEITLGSGRGTGSVLWPDLPFVGSWWTFGDNHLSGSPSLGGTIINFEKIVGTNFNDFLELSGGTVARVVDGGGGDDAIYMGGGGGSNTAIGGLGSDQLFGSVNSDVLIGGTYSGGVATSDGVRDEFEATGGTILDFQPGVDTLYIDPNGSTVSQWTDVTTSYGAAARVTMSSGLSITLVGVSADTMNGLHNGYVMAASGGTLTSGAGDDFIYDGANTTTVDRFVFPSGSGHDELVGFDKQIDTLVFSGAVSWTQTDYHGDTALVATYDGGNSSVTLVGLTMADVGSLHVDFTG
jgi:Ca2+-binding RTX toxin-like protein